MLKLLTITLLALLVITSAAEPEDEDLECCGCTDDSAECPLYQAAGLCTDPQVYKACEFSCSDCSCGDNYRDCGSRVKTESCSGADMKRHCKETCGLCACKNRYQASYCARIQAEGNCYRYGYRCEETCGQCGGCRDMARDCEVRAARGECIIKQDMIKECKKTCNQCDDTCVDNLSDCKEWIAGSSWGCQANKLFMNIHCAKSCGICQGEEETEEPTEEKEDADICKDKFVYCPLEAAKGGCTDEAVREQCPLSCKVCVCGDVESRCGEWFEQLKCYTQPTLMKIHCRATCGFCQCADSDPAMCLVWAAEGKCTDPTILAKCQDSCHVCSCGDNLDSCSADALQGKCHSDSGKMLQHCAESCNQCNQCDDNPPFKGKPCSAALEKGMCTTHPIFKVHCRKTCGFCTSDDGGDTTDDDEPWQHEEPHF